MKSFKTAVVAIVLSCFTVSGFYQALGIESVGRFNSELAEFIGCLHCVLSEVYCFYSMTG